MLDDDFKSIQDFLASAGNVEMKFLQKFDEMMSNYIKEVYDFSGVNAKENFLMLHSSLAVSYEDFSKHDENALKNLSIVLILVKNILEKLKEIQKNSALIEEEEALYLSLIETLIIGLKEDCNRNINYFKSFIEYIDNFITPINIDK